MDENNHLLKLLESQKKEIEADMNRAQEIAHIGSWRLNVVKDELLWSDEAYRIFEVPAGTSLTYEKFLSFIHPDDLKNVDEKWQKALLGDKYDVEHRILIHGKIKWVRETAILEFDDTANLLGGFGTVQDITEKMHAESSLRESEEKFAAAFRSNPDGLLLTDLESGLIIDANDSFLNISGFKREDVIGNSTLSINIYSDPAERERIIDILNTKGNLRNYEFVSRHTSGAERIVLISSEIITIRNRRIILSIIQDITSRKHMQDQLYKKNESLLKINGMLKDFVYIAAHDLRSPVASILMMSEFIKMQDSVFEKEQAFDHVIKLSKKLQLTIDGLLEMVSLQTESITNCKRIKFSEVLDDILYDCSDAISRNKIKIGTDFDTVSEIGYVEAYLKSILKNLITNAIKYCSENREPFVSISSKKEAEHVLMVIKDNGIGFDSKAAGDDLFKPFKRFTSKSEGTGMGLYIVKNIIEKNGGRVSVESKPDEGTTFYCFLKEYQ